MLIRFLRTLILYVVVIVAMRLMGKRQIGQLEPSELVVMILVSELAALPMQEIDMPLLHGLVPIATLVGLELVLSLVLLKSIRARRLICGKPVVIIHNGRLQRQEIRRARVTLDEIIEELRIQGTLDFSQVQYAIMETNGGVSVVLYPEFRPLTPSDMGQAPENTGMPTVVLNDGRWLDENLELRGLTRQFVLKELKKQGVTSEKACYVVMVDELKQVYVSTR